MIKSYKDKFTENIASGNITKGFPANLVRSAQRKLTMIDNAVKLDDLKSPPGNRLEALKDKGKDKKNRQGQHSIRINDQWRICFEWIDGNVENVEITDYH